MTCIDIWTTVYPPDPDALCIGGKSNVTVVSMNPPPANTIATSIIKITVCTETETPALNEPTGDLVFEADGDDWVAPNPTEPGIVFINIPVESEVALPEIISLSFDFAPMNLAQQIGKVVVYAPGTNQIFQIGATGNTLETINTVENVDMIQRSEDGTVFWVGDNGGLFELVATVSTKLTTLDTVHELGFGTGNTVFVMDEKDLSEDQKADRRIRLYESGGTFRNLKLNDSPEYGCFAFKPDGTFVHGTNSNPAITTGHSFAVVTYYDGNNKQWRHEFDDWSYGTNSSEEIVSAGFDNSDNCYCVSAATVETIDEITCSIRLATQEGNVSPEWVLSSNFSTLTFDYTGSFLGVFNRIHLLNLSDPATHYLKITSLECYDSGDGWLVPGFYDLSAESDWFDYSGITYADGFVFSGAEFFGSMRTNEVYHITAIRLTYTFEAVAG